MLLQILPLQVAEINHPAFRLQSEVSLRHLAVVPCAGDGSIDPELDRLAAAVDLEDVPLSGFLAALRPDALAVEALRRTIRQGAAEDKADVLVTDLALVPHLPIGRIANIYAAVVALLSLNRLEHPLHMK